MTRQIAVMHFATSILTITFTWVFMVFALKALWPQDVDPAVHLLRALAGAAGCLPRIGSRLRLNVGTAVRIAGRAMDGQPSSSTKHHLKRLAMTQREFAAPVASISEVTAPSHAN